MSKGEVDVALMGPIAYLRVDPKVKAQLMFRTVRNGKSTYRSVLFAPPTSKLTSLEALKKSKTPLKVVVMSSEVPNDVMVSAPKFSQGKVDAIIAAAKAAATTADGKKALQAALLAEGVADVKDEDFAPLRKALDAFVP